MSPFWQEIFENPRTFFGRLERGQKLVVIALASVCLTAMGLGAVFASRPTYVTLFAGLDREDGSRVVSQLESDGVPYQVAAGGDRILVEEEQVDEIRLKLAGSGLPSGGIGYEIFNDQQLGLTDALFSVNVQRALQGELERIIQITPAVSRARVLIDLPEKSGYLRPNRKPSASVTVDVRPGLLLSDHNIYAIAHLVAAAIGQGMQATEVTIVDSQLNHLHPPGGGDDTMLSTTYLQSIARIESHLQRKAESQLEDAIGPNKATVRVTVDLDLTHKETQSETREDGNKVAVRETSTTRTSKSDRGSAGGDPSAVGGSPSSSSDKDLLEEVEDSTTDNVAGVTHTLSVTSPGAIRRLSVALLLDESDEALLAKQEDLGETVKSAIGFVESRGDQFSVRAVPFLPSEASPLEPGGFQITDLLPLVKYLAEAIVVLFVLIVLKKAWSGGKSSPKQATEQAQETEAKEEDEDIRQRLARVVDEEPERAREVLLKWLREEIAT